MHQRVAIAAATAMLGLVAGTGTVLAAGGPASTLSATALRGAVYYTAPGGHTLRLDGTQAIAAGSRLNARRGAVRLVFRSGSGHASSGDFSLGAFRVERVGGAGVELILTGNSCTRAARLAAVAARARHRAPPVRGTPPPQLGVGAPPPPPAFRRWLHASAGPGFEVAGTDAQASATGRARFSVIDECDGTRVRSLAGHVIVRRKLGPAGRLSAGASELDYCHPHVGDPGFCLYLTASLRSDALVFVAALRKPVSDYAVCVRGVSSSLCVGAAGAPVRFWHVRCTLAQGGGLYAIRFRAAGRQLGYALRARAVRASSGSSTPSSCAAA